MRIVIASAVYYPMTNGVAVFAHNLATGLAKQGHEVMVLRPSFDGRHRVFKEDGVTVVALRSIRLPVIGVNFGNMGYLTEIDANQYEEELKHIFEGNFHLEERMLLNGTITRNGTPIYSDTAFNDIVLNRSDTMGIIDFDVLVNGNFLNRYSADGMIISTPTGSTGYNLSAGGPVVYPSSDIILATPISAHTLNSRTIVFNGDTKIELVVKARSSEKKQRKIVSFDGGGEIDLLNEDVIHAEKSKETISIISINNISFIEHLGKKMR